MPVLAASTSASNCGLDFDMTRAYSPTQMLRCTKLRKITSGNLYFNTIFLLNSLVATKSETILNLKCKASTYPCRYIPTLNTCLVLKHLFDRRKPTVRIGLSPPSGRIEL